MHQNTIKTCYNIQGGGLIFMKVHFLGTGAGLPSKFRHTQATILELNPIKQEYWLFDACEAVQHQILHTNIKLSKLTRIFITHLHGDHIFGLPGLLTSRSFQGGEGKLLTIYGPEGIKAFIELSLNVSGSHLNYPIEVIELSENEFNTTIDGIQIKALLLDHGIDSYGYRIEFPETIGNIIQEKLENKQIYPGPIYQLFKSKEYVEFNGELLRTKDFRTDNIPGKIIVFFGDTKPCNNELTLVSNADIVIHECTYLEGPLDLSHKYYHTHIQDIIALNSQSNVKQFLLNHISNRYLEEEIEVLKNKIQVENPELNFQLVKDFDIFEI